MYRDTHIVESLKVDQYSISTGSDIFIDEDITDPVYYREVIKTLNRAQQGDLLNMYIDCGGGSMTTTSLITKAMDTCAATFIALHCHDIKVGEGLDWLAHTASFGLGGEAPRVKKQHDHQQELIRRTLHREYEGFYTEEEINLILDTGDESLLFPEEVEVRWKSFVEYHKNKKLTEMEEAFNTQCSEEDAAVDEALQGLLKEGEITEDDIIVSDKIRNLLEERFSGEVEKLPVEESSSNLDKLVSETKDEGSLCKFTEGGGDVVSDEKGEQLAFEFEGKELVRKSLSTKREDEGGES